MQPSQSTTKKTQIEDQQKHRLKEESKLERTFNQDYEYMKEKLKESQECNFDYIKVSQPLSAELNILKILQAKTRELIQLKKNMTEFRESQEADACLKQQKKVAGKKLWDQSSGDESPSLLDSSLSNGGSCELYKNIQHSIKRISHKGHVSKFQLSDDEGDSLNPQVISKAVSGNDEVIPHWKRNQLLSESMKYSVHRSKSFEQ